MSVGIIVGSLDISSYTQMGFAATRKKKLSHD